MASPTKKDLHYLQAELRELSKSSGQIFEFLEQVSLDGIWYWDLENPQHEWVSPAFWVSLGYDPAEREHLASEWRELIDPEDLKLAIQGFDAHCANPEQPYDQVVRYRHRDGSTVWMRCRAIAVRDEHGKPVRMLGAHTDLTEVKSSEARLRSFIEALPGVGFVLSESGRYLDVMSTGSVHLLAAPVEDLIGSNLAEILPREVADELLRKIREVLTRGKASQVEYHLDTPGGVRWFEARVAPYALSGQTERAVVWIANDVTDRVELMQRLERSNAELQSFAAVLAHDLRAPLRGISHIATWIREDTPGDLSDEVEGHLKLLQDRVDRMNALIAGVHAFSRLAREVHIQDVDVAKEISDVWEVLARGRDGLRLDFVGERIVLRADRVLFGQIAQNLLGNALDHHDQEAAVVTVRSARWGRKHVLEFEDDGPGIRESAARRVFDPFQSTKKVPVGELSGMGLSIAKKCAEVLGGELMLVPSDGRGATFRLTMPARSEPIAPAGGPNQ